jgi:hypothetical protein
MAKKDPPKTPPAKKGSAKGVKTPVHGIHHDVSTQEECRKEMNQKRNARYRKKKSDEKKEKEKQQQQKREANKQTKNQAIMAKLKPVVCIKKADPMNSKMIIVQPHVGNLEECGDHQLHDLDGYVLPTREQAGAYDAVVVNVQCHRSKKQTERRRSACHAEG